MVQMLFGACLVLLGANGEVQIILNFVLQGFRFYDILAASLGEKEGEENCKLWKWYNMRMRMNDTKQSGVSGEFAVEKFDRNDKLQSRGQG